MYTSGPWEGFWVHTWHGRQAMTPFALHFVSGEVSGEGRDIVGRFTFAGTYDERTGVIEMTKQYIGRHRVAYRGSPDGEGCIQGMWNIGADWTGPFLMRPVVRRPSGDEPIQEMG